LFHSRSLLYLEIVGRRESHIPDQIVQLPADFPASILKKKEATIACQYHSQTVSTFTASMDQASSRTIPIQSRNIATFVFLKEDGIFQQAPFNTNPRLLLHIKLFDVMIRGYPKWKALTEICRKEISSFMLGTIRGNEIGHVSEVINASCETCVIALIIFYELPKMPLPTMK
jgi:hypothetical protein